MRTGKAAISSIMARASASSKGAARKVTSLRASTKMPPSPNMTMGPKTGSRCSRRRGWSRRRPWRGALGLVTMGATRQPSIAASGWRGAGGGEDLVEGGLGGGAVGDAEADAPDVALVEDVRREHLEDDGEAELRRRVRRLAGGPRLAGGHGRDAGGGGDVEGGELVERAGGKVGGGRDGRPWPPLPEGAREAREGPRPRASRASPPRRPGSPPPPDPACSPGCRTPTPRSACRGSRPCARSRRRGSLPSGPGSARSTPGS